MTVQEIVSAVMQLGFPAVAFGGMFWWNIQLTKMYREDQQKNREAIVNNTAAMLELKNVMQSGKN